MQIVKLVVSRARTSVEIADMFNIKVQVVYDLTKDAKKRQIYFIKKKEAELRWSRQHAAIVRVVSNAIAES